MRTGIIKPNEESGALAELHEWKSKGAIAQGGGVLSTNKELTWIFFTRFNFY